MSLILQGREFDFQRGAYLMGVINVTPDSFFDGGRFMGRDQARRQARLLLEQGADILDIGGESSRPGADGVPEDEELRRVIPVIEAVAGSAGAVVSVDTTKARVAERALEAGAAIVNDISALRADPDMARVVQKHGCPVCLMHMKGTPKTMQKNPSYINVVEEVKSFLAERSDFCRALGLAREKIWLDPGIGFGKRLEDNLVLLNHLDELAEPGAPLLVGTSRKSFIGSILGCQKPADRLFGTLGSVAAAFARGCRIFRVHDVKPAREMLAVIQAIREERALQPA